MLLMTVRLFHLFGYVRGERERERERERGIRYSMKYAEPFVTLHHP
jgi:hypothetical protein